MHQLRTVRAQSDAHEIIEGEKTAQGETFGGDCLGGKCAGEFEAVEGDCQGDLSYE